MQKRHLLLLSERVICIPVTFLCVFFSIAISPCRYFCITIFYWAFSSFFTYFVALLNLDLLCEQRICGHCFINRCRFPLYFLNLPSQWSTAAFISSSRDLSRILVAVRSTRFSLKVCQFVLLLWSLGMMVAGLFVIPIFQLLVYGQYMTANSLTITSGFSLKLKLNFL